jgi:acetyltransferase-like isoleucine patch superfamily enzyme
MRATAAVALMFRLLAERIVRAPVHSRLRPAMLRMLGARIGRGVRIDEVMFINLSVGFRNLVIHDCAYVGAGTIVDLTGTIEVGAHTSISPGCTLMSHSDPGSTYGNELASHYPRTSNGIRIGAHCWVGCRSTILDGVTIGDRAVVGAASLVTRDVDTEMIAFGIPARVMRRLEPTVVALQPDLVAP